MSNVETWPKNLFVAGTLRDYLIKKYPSEELS